MIEDNNSYILNSLLKNNGGIKDYSSKLDSLNEELNRISMDKSMDSSKKIDEMKKIKTLIDDIKKDIMQNQLENDVKETYSYMDNFMNAHFENYDEKDSKINELQALISIDSFNSELRHLSWEKNHTEIEVRRAKSKEDILKQKEEKLKELNEKIVERTKNIVEKLNKINYTGKENSNGLIEKGINPEDEFISKHEKFVFDYERERNELNEKVVSVSEKVKDTVKEKYIFNKDMLNQYESENFLTELKNSSANIKI